MATTINDIVNINITLEKPVQTSTSFGVLLLVGPGPTNKSEDLKDICSYTGLESLTKAGYTVNDPIYIAASVAFAQDPVPLEIYVCTRKSAGDEKYEDIEQSLDHALEYGGWYGVCEVGFSNEDINKAAAYIEKTEKIFSFSTTETSIITNSTYLRTHGWYTNQAAPEDTYLHVAITAKCLGYDPGSEIWALKALEKINPSNITATQAKSLDDNNMNYYVRIANANVTQNGKVIGNEWIDIIRFRDWQKNDMQLSIYNFFRQKNKVPYTDEGITAIDAQMIASLKRGVDAGGISADAFDDGGNKIPGYSTYVPSASQISAEQKQGRQLPGCKWSAKLLGAIQAVEIKGTLSY